MKMKTAGRVCFLVLTLVVSAAAQGKSQFEFSGDEKDYKIEKQAVTLDYSEVEIIDDPVQGGLIILRRDRWKNWVARGIYVLIVNVLLIILMASIPRNSDANLIICYLVAGASFSMNFWISFFGILLLRLKAFLSGTVFVPASLLFFVLTYFFILKVKKSDISLSELKESFKKLEQATKEDPRLVSVSGVPCDWPDEDFLK